ncbi:protein of unknown function [Brochothrix thermosphacta]|nr:protein of unknown function [Brochothrix thermosphacta]
MVFIFIFTFVFKKNKKIMKTFAKDVKQEYYKCILVTFTFHTLSEYKL